jgi:hypothetical protein
MKTIETRVIDALQPHPRNAALYGNDHGNYDDKLVESLLAGIWPGEIQVTTSDIIISGHRRCEHAIFANIESAEVWVRTDLPEDPASPQVLEALLQANLQRNKSNEQKLREFALWKEVEKKLAPGRKGANQYTKEGPGQNARDAKPGDARDLAAKRVGLGCGSKAEKAHKALVAADQAEASGDAEQVAKAKEVKKALEKGISAATRKATEVGLIEPPKPRGKGQPPAQAERSDGGQPPHNPEPSIQPDPISGIPPRQPGMPLPQLSKDIISRERKAAAKRTVRLAALAELDAEMTALWKYAQKRFDADGRSVLRNHMGLADEAMVADGVISSACTALGISPEATYEEMLWAVDAMAKRVSRSARQAIYLFGYRDGMPE